MRVCCPITRSHWQAWGEWSDCSVTCDGGTSTRTRECDNAFPDSPCEGDSEQSAGCNGNLCGEYQWFSVGTRKAFITPEFVRQKVLFPSKSLVLPMYRTGKWLYLDVFMRKYCMSCRNKQRFIYQTLFKLRKNINCVFTPKVLTHAVSLKNIELLFVILWPVYI